MKFKVSLIFLTLILIFYHKAYSYDNKIINSIEIKKEVLDNLSIALKSDEIQKRWDKYIYSKYHCSNKEFISAILNSGEAYFAFIMNYEKAYNRFNNEKKDASVKWYTDLKDKFGNAYVKNNDKNIRKILFYLHRTHEERFTVESLKKIIYQELKLKELVIAYCKSFIEFYATLDKKSQSAHKDTIEFINKLLKLYQKVNFYKIVSDFKADLLAAQVENSIDPKLVKYMSKHKALSKPFSLKVFRSLDQNIQ